MNYSIKIDEKWQKKWKDKGFYKFKRQNNKEKHYVCEMFSYPSGAKLHVGHWYNYSLSDSYARLKFMEGKNVFQPMGFDSFGLPAENYAIKTGIHPEVSTIKNMETMKKQLMEMGAFFAWDHTLSTCDPSYYKWTQWLFLQLYKKGLAYRKNAPVNWCSSCQTVLANEQCENGLCERCNNIVVRKNLTQWFFKITAYAEELLQGLNELDWPEKTLKIQKNWIGKSSGGKIVFALADSTKAVLNENFHSDLFKEYELRRSGSSIAKFTQLEVFTTRPDTLMGVSYVVMAPEHPLAPFLATQENRVKVLEYIEETAKVSEIDRQASNREVSGVFTGSYVVHPVTKKEVPLYLSDYVIASYGTGVVMAVPAHDERDFRFATKFNLPINCVIVPEKDMTADQTTLPYCEKGVLINSGTWDNLDSNQAKTAILAYLKERNLGEEKVNYRLRDWLVSRQRYWGAPIPIIHCEHCGLVPVPEQDLPVLLPKDVEFLPDGQSPLAKSQEFIHCDCPQCGKKAMRDVDTLDTFVCSSWYYLRYADANNDQMAFDPEIVNDLLPVDKYIGGSEHAAMHLLYARFITKALRDMGYLKFSEPFTSLVHQGTILGEDGQKMSKSLGNTISPDPYIQEYGSDVFRLYLAFGFAYTDGGPWSDSGVKAIAKFIARLARFYESLFSFEEYVGFARTNLKDKDAVRAFINQIDWASLADLNAEEKEIHRLMHHSIKGVTVDANRFQFNTSIARIMELSNSLIAYFNQLCNNKNYGELSENDKIKLAQKYPFILFVSLKMLQLLAPFAPHFTEEIFSFISEDDSIFLTDWPIFNEKSLKKDFIEIAIQVNSQIKCRIEVPSDATSEEIRELAQKEPILLDLLKGKEIAKWIYIPGRIANFVLKK